MQIVCRYGLAKTVVSMVCSIVIVGINLRTVKRCNLLL